MSALDELLLFIFDGGRPALYADFEQWLRKSRRFLSFAHEYRSKIRAKVRNAGGGERMDDLRAELETAAQLLQHKSFALEYERYAALKQRGPDFTVTYKTHTPFNVEVRRLRDVAPDSAEPLVLTSKLMAVLCEKVRQMPPSIVNLLWLSSEAEISKGELGEAVKALGQVVDDESDEFIKRYGFRNRADFHRHYLHLSGVVLPQMGTNVVWLNSIARHKVPRGIVLAVRRLAAGGG